MYKLRIDVFAIFFVSWMLISAKSSAQIRIDIYGDSSYAEITSEQYVGLICGTDYFFALTKSEQEIGRYSRVSFRNRPFMQRWNFATWYPTKIVLKDGGWFGDAYIDRKTLKWGFTQCNLRKIPEWKTAIENYLSELKADNKL